MSDLDEAKLASWMTGAVSSFTGLAKIVEFPGGQSNPTYRLDTPQSSYVLRRKPFGDLLPSAHAVDREYRLLEALYPTGFPVPRPIAFCEDTSVIGAVFYLMEMVEGRILWDGTMADIPKLDRHMHYNAMIDTLAQLHSLDHNELGLGDFSPPGNYMARQIARWTKQYRAAETDEITAMEKLIDWLPRTVPKQTKSSIIHGDFRLNNLIFSSDEPSIRAVLDWELATIGDPLADFCYLGMNWVIPRDGISGIGGIDLHEAGLPTLDYAIERYCAAAGLDSLPDLNWYFAYNLFRVAAIIQGIKKRAIDGNAANEEAAIVGQRVGPLALTAWDHACLAGASEEGVV